MIQTPRPTPDDSAQTEGQAQPSPAHVTMGAPPVRIPQEDAVPILTDEVDVFWEFEDRDTRHDPTVKPLVRG